MILAARDSRGGGGGCGLFLSRLAAAVLVVAASEAAAAAAGTKRIYLDVPDVVRKIPNEMHIFQSD